MSTRLKRLCGKQCLLDACLRSYVAILLQATPMKNSRFFIMVENPHKRASLLVAFNNCVVLPTIE